MKDYYKRVPEELFNMFNSNSKGLGKEEVEKNGLNMAIMN